MYVRTYVHMYVCMYTPCMDIIMYMCMIVFIYIYVYGFLPEINVFVFVYSYIYIYMTLFKFIRTSFIENVTLNIIIIAFTYKYLPISLNLLTYSTREVPFRCPHHLPYTWETTPIYWFCCGRVMWRPKASPVTRIQLQTIVLIARQRWWHRTRERPWRQLIMPIGNAYGDYLQSNGEDHRIH